VLSGSNEDMTILQQ